MKTETRKSKVGTETIMTDTPVVVLPGYCIRRGSVDVKAMAFESNNAVEFDPVRSTLDEIKNLIGDERIDHVLIFERQSMIKTTIDHDAQEKPIKPYDVYHCRYGFVVYLR